MADLKAVFVIMLMINIGISVVYNIMDLDDFAIANKEANSTLSNYFLGGYGATVTPTDTINQTGEMGKPITEDSGNALTIIRSESTFQMITKGLVMILTSSFGVLYVLLSLSAPPFVIWLIGVPFTLIYVISGIMFIRGVN